MNKKLLALVMGAGLALSATHAAAITASSGLDPATGTTTTTATSSVTTNASGVLRSSVSAIGDSLFSWFVCTCDAGDLAFVTFTNDQSNDFVGEYNFAKLGQSGPDPTFSFTISNGFPTIDLTEEGTGSGTFLLAAGETISFGITGSSPGVSASGQLNFSPAVIPLPAGVFLLLTALGGLAAVRKVSKKPEMA